MGARWDATSATWRFGVWSAAATSVRVELYRRDRLTEPVLTRDLVRDGEAWGVAVAEAEIAGADLYGFRVTGQGGRFDPSKLLLDPWALRVFVPPGDAAAARRLARQRGYDTAGTAPVGVLTAERPAVVEGARVPDDQLVVYETHVRGYTRAATDLDESIRGTFRGMIERLDHLVELGVTALELLPVHASDPGEGSYWGYMPLAWLAVEDRYAASGDGAAELAELCIAAAERGIEVWLDVVYNHTTEEDAVGPTYHLRGIDDAAYYVVDEHGTYLDDAGCGNILRAAHPAGSELVLASLDRLADLGVAGFRFDLATILGRNVDGKPQRQSDLLDRITAWAGRRSVRLIAEAWDVAAYEVGEAFAGRTWAQWNDRFRNGIRSFLRAEQGQVDELIRRVQGSPDLFGPRPARSVNFITAHDGFTLYDLVAYDRKHNEANGWGGTDGTDDNRSWNCGWEGEDGAPFDVLALRRRQVRNALVLLLLSAGVPMMVAGDEMGRTQRGNNNAYNQDNEISWVDWERAAEWDDLRRFTAGLIRLRRAHPALGREAPWGDDVTFFGSAGAVDHRPGSRTLGWHLHPAGGVELVVIANAWWEQLTFQLPGSGWLRVIDTALPAPYDIRPPGSEEPIDGEVYRLGPRSTVVLVRPGASGKGPAAVASP